jgi:hypothetical protein
MKFLQRNLISYTLVKIAYVTSAAAQSACDLKTASLPFLPTCNVTLPGLPTVYSSGILLTINNAQLCALPSTVASACLLESSDVCKEPWIGNMTEAECRSRRGNFLVSSDFLSTTSQDELSALFSDNPNWRRFMNPLPAFQKGTRDSIQLTPSINTSALHGIISQGVSHQNSHFSSDRNSYVLRDLRDSGKISAMSFGLDVGSDSSSSPRPGRLILGGYEPSKVMGTFFPFKMDSHQPKVNDRSCPMQVTVTGIKMRYTPTTAAGQVRRNETQELKIIGRDAGVTTCVEPYDRLFRFSETSLENLVKWFKQDLGLTYQAPDDNGRIGNLLSIEPGLIFPITDGLPRLTMEVSLAGGLTVEIPSDHLIRNLRGLDANGAPTSNDSFAEVQIYHEAGAQLAPVVGRAFLSQVRVMRPHSYLIFS